MISYNKIINRMKRPQQENQIFEINKESNAGHWTPEEHLEFIKGRYW